MQSDIETKAYNIYLEQMITANEGFWRDAPLFAEPGKVIRIQEDFTAALFSSIGDGGVWGDRRTPETSPANAIAASKLGGGMSIKTTALDGGETYIFSRGSIVQFKDLVPVWFETVLNVQSDLSLASIAAGVTDGGTAVGTAVPPDFLATDGGTVLGDHDGALFHINEASTGQVQFHVSNEAVQANSNLGTTTATTDFRVGFKWDGEGTLTPWMNGRPYATASFTPASSLMDIVFCAIAHHGTTAHLEVSELNVIIDRRNDPTLV
jgi:hypothetical protein|tara:strand:+ start:7244 stop:8038 length:795 start_codon:yes stop_codon:yes gene_type:complete